MRSSERTPAQLQCRMRAHGRRPGACAGGRRSERAACLKRAARTADRTSMSMLSSVAASGLGLLDAADQRLRRSADAFTRSGEPADPNAAPPPDQTADAVDAAVGVIYGRSEFRMGVKLIEVGRDTEQALIDLLA
jgi:hypothetical protein